MSDEIHLYEEIVRLTACWTKGGDNLYPPFPPSSFAALTRDDLSRFRTATSSA